MQANGHGYSQVANAHGHQQLVYHMQGQMVPMVVPYGANTLHVMPTYMPQQGMALQNNSKSRFQGQ